MDIHTDQQHDYNIGQKVDYDIGAPATWPERSGSRRMVWVGRRVLDLYTLADTAIRLTLSVAALSGALHASSSHDTHERTIAPAPFSLSPDEGNQTADAGVVPVTGRITNGYKTVTIVSGTAAGSASNTNTSNPANVVTVTNNNP